MTTTLITGANKGLGYETARRLIAEGHDVWVCARDEARGRAAADELGARFVQLDVTDDASVAAAVDTVGELDVLVNNAGISGGMVPVPEVTPDLVERVFATNVVGLVRVTQAFVPALQRSANPVIVNVSSGMGSIGVTSDPERLESTIVGLQYPASKSAVNMLTTQYAKALPGMRVNCVDPGYTATDFNQHRGYKTVEQGADAIVRMALLDGSGPTGTYVDDQGVVPW
ncbi:SDR family oxidoreductase [Solirubrobacter soli]|uniref:SDR family oxidoreductase n=1 Tax=Solirubrobacter soli TaxID=363832 RepID=UPI000418C241|nr:SDR family oxidoreductase [Solirubrobacter soli]